MAENTKIEWAHHTWNPWRGCAHAKLPDGSEHPGCLNCYAEAMSGRNPKSLGEWGEGTRRAIGVAGYWRLPDQWNRKAGEAGVRERVFFSSLADVFEDHPDLIEPRRRAFEIIDRCTNLDFLILTKRPQNIRAMLPDYAFHACVTGDCPHDFQSQCDTEGGKKFRENVWLLTSVSDQASADAMIPELLKCRDLAPVLGLSIEPLLGPIDLGKWSGEYDCQDCEYRGFKADSVEVDGYVEAGCPFCGSVDGFGHCNAYGVKYDRLDWVIVGGESGHGARPMHPEWARSLRDQCQAAGVPFFFKQWGEFAPSIYGSGPTPDHLPASAGFYFDAPHPPGKVWRFGKKAAGRLLDGRTWDEFPEVAR